MYRIKKFIYLYILKMIDGIKKKKGHGNHQKPATSPNLSLLRVSQRAKPHEQITTA